MSKFYLIVLLVVTQNLLLSQVVLDSTNFPYAGMSYQRFYAVADTVGPSGANVYFDFSIVYIAFSDTVTYLDASATPFFSEHPNAQTSIFFDDGNGQQRYYYYAKDSNAFWENGFTAVTDLGSGLDTIQAIYAPADVDTIISNQFTYGHIETEYSKATVIIDAFVNVDLHKIKNIEVDAWGTIATPFNVFDDMLRVKYTEYKYDSVFVSGTYDSSNLDTLYYFYYFVKGIPYPVVVAHTDSAGIVEYVEIIKIPPIINGCTDSLAVNYNPSANNDDGSCIYCSPVSYSATPDTSICFGDSVTLSVTGGLEWNWSTGDTTPSVTVYPDTSWIYTVLISNEPLCWETENIFVTVNKPVIADFYITNNTFSVNDSVQFINLSENAASYFWDFDDTVNGTSIEQNPLHKFSNAGDKTVMLIASNSCYTDTILKIITITGIYEFDKLISKLNVYPNPGNNNSNIEYSIKKHLPVQINIYDIYGKLCASKTILSDNDRVKIHDIAGDLPEGMYIISLQAGQQASKIKWIKI